MLGVQKPAFGVVGGFELLGGKKLFVLGELSGLFLGGRPMVPQTSSTREVTFASFRASICRTSTRLNSVALNFLVGDGGEPERTRAGT